MLRVGAARMFVILPYLKPRKHDLLRLRESKHGKSNIHTRPFHFTIQFVPRERSLRIWEKGFLREILESLRISQLLN